MTNFLPHFNHISQKEEKVKQREKLIDVLISLITLRKLLGWISLTIRMR